METPGRPAAHPRPNPDHHTQNPSPTLTKPARRIEAESLDLEVNRPGKCRAYEAPELHRFSVSRP